MQRFRLLSLVIAMVVMGPAASAVPVHLRCEYLENPLGIDAASPHFSWRSDDTGRDWTQTAYEILVASDDEGLRAGKGDVWDSGRVQSGSR